jgi:hypothetical protein
MVQITQAFLLQSEVRLQKRKTCCRCATDSGSFTVAFGRFTVVASRNVHRRCDIRSARLLQHAVAVQTEGSSYGVCNQGDLVPNHLLISGRSGQTRIATREHR